MWIRTLLLYIKPCRLEKVLVLKMRTQASRSVSLPYSLQDGDFTQLSHPAGNLDSRKVYPGRLVRAFPDQHLPPASRQRALQFSYTLPRHIENINLHFSRRFEMQQEVHLVAGRVRIRQGDFSLQIDIGQP